MTRLSKDIKVGNSNTTLESLVPYILYEDGTNGNVPLNDDVRNYKFLEIYYHQGWVYGYTKVDTPYNKNFAINISNYYDQNVSIHNCRKNYYVNVNSLDVIRGAYSVDTLQQNIGLYTNDSGVIFITKVIGYK